MTPQRGMPAGEDMDGVLAEMNRTVARDVAQLLRKRYPPVVYGIEDPGYLPVFVLHSVAEEELTNQLTYLQANGYRTVGLDEAVAWMLGRGRLPAKAVVLTIDDGRPSTWTVAAPLLERYGMRATAYVLPGYLESGPVRPTLVEVWRGEALRGTVEASEGDDAARFLRWSEVEALQKGGVIDIQSHSMLHRRVFTGPGLRGFLSAHWDGPIYNVPRECTDRRAWTRRTLQEAAGSPAFEHQPLLGAQRAWVGGGAFRDLCLDMVGTQGPAFFASRSWHRRLRRLRRRARGREPQWLNLRAEKQWELEESKRVLEARLGHGRVRHFCYPNGAGGRDTVELAQQAGYVSGAWALLDHRITNRRGADPHLLSRIKHDFIYALAGDGRRSLLELLKLKIARRIRGEKGY